MALGKNLLIRGANSVSKIVGEKGFLKPFRYGSLGGSSAFVGALEYRAPGTVGDWLACFREVVGVGWFGPPAVVFSWEVGADGKVGHWSSRFGFLEFRPLG